jgi:hypothetical protein
MKKMTVKPYKALLSAATLLKLLFMFSGDSKGRDEDGTEPGLRRFFRRPHSR